MNLKKKKNEKKLNILESTVYILLPSMKMEFRREKLKKTQGL